MSVRLFFRDIVVGSDVAVDEDPGSLDAVG
jgi:hypothetical protein